MAAGTARDRPAVPQPGAPGRRGELRDRLSSWMVRDDLEDAWPELPEGIEDRNADVWEPLLAVADAAGGDLAASCPCSGCSACSGSTS